MAWLFLLVAGLAEMGMVISLKKIDGFQNGSAILSTLFFSGVSLYLLSLSLKTIPIGTAYAIWTGIGAAGSVIAGMIFFDEPRDGKRIFLIACIIAGAIGLKITA
jgi:quaternary ammonium compound-resistance protein SugE